VNAGSGNRTQLVRWVVSGQALNDARGILRDLSPSSIAVEDGSPDLNCKDSGSASMEYRYHYKFCLTPLAPSKCCAICRERPHRKRRLAGGYRSVHWHGAGAVHLESCLRCNVSHCCQHLEG
jgi:hypothetical protein